MKNRTGHRRPRTFVALLFAALFTMTGLTTAAAPAVTAVDAVSSQSAYTPSADSYVSIAWSPSTLGWYWVRSGDRQYAIDHAMDLCNLYKSDNSYDCASAGWASNSYYLALALSWKNGPSGYSSGSTATYAGKNAVAWCKYYGGADSCRVAVNVRGSE